MNYSDEQLVLEYLRGDKKSFELLLKRYLNPIYNFTRQYVKDKQEAEDVTQDVFVKVWRKIEKFDRNKKFKTWIFSIAKNTCLDWLKKKRPIAFSMFDSREGGNTLAETLIDSSPLLDELAERANMSKRLTEAVKNFLFVIVWF